MEVEHSSPFIKSQCDNNEIEVTDTDIKYSIGDSYQLLNKENQSLNFQSSFTLPYRNDDAEVSKFSFTFFCSKFPLEFSCFKI